jgi:hypothetical protein
VACGWWILVEIFVPLLLFSVKGEWPPRPRPYSGGWPRVERGGRFGDEDFLAVGAELAPEEHPSWE